MTACESPIPFPSRAASPRRRAPRLKRRRRSRHGGHARDMMEERERKREREREGRLQRELWRARRRPSRMASITPPVPRAGGCVWGPNFPVFCGRACTPLVTRRFVNLIDARTYGLHSWMNGQWTGPRDRSSLSLSLSHSLSLSLSLSLSTTSDRMCAYLAATRYPPSRAPAHKCHGVKFVAYICLRSCVRVYNMLHNKCKHGHAAMRGPCTQTRSWVL
jgi:hypothetical protein